MLVVIGDEAKEIFLQFNPGAMHALRQSLSTENAEETFDQIDPGGVRRRVVKADARVALQPLVGGLVLMNV